MELLFCLGFALGLCRYTVSRKFWEAFPGGMPYITINLKGGS